MDLNTNLVKVITTQKQRKKANPQKETKKINPG
jgi:hypothetical protein